MSGDLAAPGDSANSTGPDPSELVSIVIMAYNSASTIRETLQGCYSQTYPLLEVIVTDDGSQDDTVSIARDLAARFPAIKTIVIANPTNDGIVRNCKRGLDKASGTWAKIIGADDILLPDGIADLVTAGQSAKADVVLSQFQSFGDESRLYPLPWTVRGIGSRNLARSMLMGFGAIAPGALVRLGALRKESLPSDQYIMAEDSLFYELAKRGYRFTYLEKVTVRFRVHKNQVTANESTAARTLRAEQSRFFDYEGRRVLGRFHPYYLHVRYQRFVDGMSGKLPRPIQLILRRLDPILFARMYVDRDLPWQRTRR